MPLSIPFVISLVLGVLWLAMLVRAAIHGSAIPTLAELRLPSLSEFPRVSIVLTARDEREAMEHSLPKLLAVNYPNVEFILIDDRSTDGTGALIDCAAQKDPRVRPVHVTALPEGWLGKVNALEQGVRIATGEWLLFTDADIHFEGDVLQRAVEYALANKLQHVAMIPESLEQRNLLLAALETAFGVLFVQKSWAPALADVSKRDYIGVGAFNMVEARFFRSTSGFEWLRLEVLEDIGIGLLTKRSGGRSSVLFGRGLLGFQWYPTLGQMIRGLEKNSFGGFGRYNALRTTLGVLWGLIVIIGPLALWLATGELPILLLYLAIYWILPGLTGIALYSKVHMRPLVLSILPAGFLCLMYAVIRSMVITLRTRGIRWRGTYYPLAELRRMQRVRL